MHGEHEYRQIRHFFADLLEHVDAAAIRHGNVKQHHIAIAVPGELGPPRCRFFASAATTMSFCVGKDLLETFTHDSVIVSDENADGWIGRGWLAFHQSILMRLFVLQGFVGNPDRNSASAAPGSCDRQLATECVGALDHAANAERLGFEAL